MATLNRSKKVPVKTVTHEGAVVNKITNAEELLRRTVMACMLWEDTFYEDGKDVASRITEYISHISPERVAEIAIEARTQMKLRHVPLLIVRQMARLDSHKYLVAKTLNEVIQRPDELTEFLAIYWKDKKETLSAQVKKGLALAFKKFDEYALAKYNRDHEIKLRDVLFLAHAKPVGGISGFTKKERKKKTCRFPKDEGSVLYRKLVEGKLETPETWEVEISAAGSNKASWEKLLEGKKLGALALIRNLRNMIGAGVTRAMIRTGITNMKTDRVLPFRFIAAARYAPDFEPELEQAMFKCLDEKAKLPGKTVLLIDVSGSMDDALSAKSDMKRHDAAYGLAILAREICEDVSIYSFSNDCIKIPARRGFALRDAIHKSQSHSGTYTGKALTEINASEDYDRVIIITDEQSADTIPMPKGKGYIINVGTYDKSIGYGPWVRINGWSEAIIDYIRMYEDEPKRGKDAKVGTKASNRNTR
jgi:hypothetical protein